MGIYAFTQCNSLKPDKVNEYLQSPKYKVDIAPNFLFEVFQILATADVTSYDMPI